LAVRIRLKRIGKRKQSYFRIIVVDQKTKRDGSIIDDLGYYQPWRKTKNCFVNKEKYEEWLKKGAVPSLTVKNIYKVILKKEVVPSFGSVSEEKVDHQEDLKS